jgi:hypothetical protein
MNIHTKALINENIKIYEDYLKRCIERKNEYLKQLVREEKSINFYINSIRELKEDLK